MVEVYHIARERLNNRCVQTGDGSEAHDGPALLPLAKAVDFDILEGCGVCFEGLRELELSYLLLYEPVCTKQPSWPGGIVGPAKTHAKVLEFVLLLFVLEFLLDRKSTRLNSQSL